MPRCFRRFGLAFVFSLTVVALDSHYGISQPLNAEDFKKKIPLAGDARVRVVELRDGKRQVLKGPEEKKNVADMLTMARVLIYPITDPLIYYPPEPTGKNATELKPVAADSTIQYRLDEFDRFITKPGPNSKLSFDQYDYLLEFGKSVDTVLKELLVDGSPDYIRVNAVRMLAMAAKSGAPAHAKMITDLITDPNTKPEILVYALQAAGALLSAYDPRLSGGLNAGGHSIKEPELVRLVQALEKVINRQTPYGGNKNAKAVATSGTGIVKEKTETPKVDDKAPKTAPKVDPKTTGKLDSAATPGDHLDADQAAVIRFIRRQAVKALAQSRYPQYSTPTATVRPLFTLARIAVNDGSFVPDLGPEEYGEAVIGLSNLNSFKGVNIDGVLNCIGIGTSNFARRKVGNTSDISIPWKIFANRIDATFTDWQKVMANNGTMTAAASKVTPLTNLITAQVLTPMEKYDKSNPSANAPGLEGLQQWLTPRLTGPLTVYDDLKPDEVAKYKLKPVLAKN